MMIAIALGVVALLTAGYAWARFRPQPEEPFLVWRCPGCDQKIRYLSEKAGRPALCPRCKHKWTLPMTPSKLAPTNQTYQVRRNGTFREGARVARSL
jgi:hypothetical protein